MKRCFSCFKEYYDSFDVCPHCGSVFMRAPKEPVHLYPGTVLAGRYIIGETVGSGGFGIIYKAWDVKLEIIVAVKEFFPARLVTRAEGLKNLIVSRKAQDEFNYRKTRFLAEARDMAKFGAHRNIPNVYEFFEENNTAYIVMELLKGISLSEYMSQNGGIVDKDFAVMVANEICNALGSLHEKGIIHRDVAPDNVFICMDKEIKVKLLDLGGAKLADSTDKIIDVILKPGYSPAEQYDSSQSVGPETDIYALGATMYVMLTGQKPDESTNRKLSDTLPSPRQINSSIPENLSNTVMKAMAIDRHMRFKNTAEFAKAVNGRKKIVSLNREKHIRSMKRIAGIVAAFMVVVATIGFVIGVYSDKKAEATLAPATITVWYCCENGTENNPENEAMEAMLQSFTKTFPDVKWERRGFAPSEYESALRKAKAEGNMPTIYESTGISDEIVGDSIDLTNVIESDQFKEALFLDQYSDYYNNQKRVPLAIEVPMAAIITRGTEYTSYNSDFYTEIKDFDYANIATDEKYQELVDANVNSALFSAKREDFFNNQANKSAVILTSTMAVNECRQTLTNYEKSYVFPKMEEINCRFIYEWSISGGSEEQVKAAETLLSWMLGNVYQSNLMINECNDGQIPVNELSFNSKIQSKILEPIKEIYPNFVFESEEE